MPSHDMPDRIDEPLMGRHEAPAAPARHAVGPRAADRAPITDPRLFDRPLVTVAPAAPRRPRTLDLDVLADEVQPVAPHLRPVAVRSLSREFDTGVAPAVQSRSFGTARREAPRGIRMRQGDDASEAVRTARSFVRGREAALAACAVAVVGAVSGVAAILPSTNSEAQAAGGPVTAPVPTRGASTSTAGACFAPAELTRAMRRHHHARRAPHTPAVPTADPSTPWSASPSTTPSDTPSSTSTPRPTASPVLSGQGLLPSITSALGAGLWSLRDFGTQESGAVVRGTLKGAGVDDTVLEMVKNSSTKAGLVPGDGNNQGGLANPVNPLYLVRGVTDLEDLTIRGTEQGHLYNGVYMSGANLTIKHAEIDDIPGDSNANPGETFAIGVNRASGTNTVDDLTIKGGTGALSSAAGLAINNSDADWNISDLTTRDLKYSAGIALWQVRGTLNIHNWVQSGGARSLGAERVAAKVNLYDPQWEAGTTGHDVTYTWDGGYSGGSINFYYSSASKVPDRKIKIITNHASGIAASVHVYVGGVQQNTSDYVTVS